MRYAPVDRRAFLAAAAALAMSGPAMAAPAPFFKRHDLPIGIQLYTLGPDAAKDLDGTLKAIAGIGYKTVELAGFYGHTPLEMRQALDAAGLTCPSAHIQARGTGADPTFADLGKLADAMHAVGARTVVLPSTYIPDRLDQHPAAGEGFGPYLARVLSQLTIDDWKFNADFLNQKGAALKQAGLGVGYHNHNFEFAPVGSTNGMEILLQHTDPAIVSFEMDVGWVASAGADPFELFARQKGRFSKAHVKDIKASTKPNFTLAQDPTEIGSGILDWKKLLPAAYACGVRGFFLEQEPPFTRPRIEAVKMGYDYLAGVVA